jgi:hypothetical protein
MVSPTDRLRAWRIVQAAWLASWFIKLDVLVRVFWGAERAPIESVPLFPQALVSPHLAQGAFVIPIVGLAGFVLPQPRALRVIALVELVSAVVLLCHVHGYNDMTYVTAFWTAVWLVWWAGAIDRDDRSPIHACAIAQGIVGLCFFGGAVGKLTAEYWGGEAFYQLYVVEKHYFPFDWLRNTYDAATLRAASVWPSRAVVVIEVILATMILWPPKLALAVGGLAVGVMVSLARTQLLSVLGSLLGLLVASAYLDAKARG